MCGFLRKKFFLWRFDGHFLYKRCPWISQFYGKRWPPGKLWKTEICVFGKLRNLFLFDKISGQLKKKRLAFFKYPCTKSEKNIDQISMKEISLIFLDSSFLFLIFKIISIFYRRIFLAWLKKRDFGSVARSGDFSPNPRNLDSAWRQNFVAIASEIWTF